MPRVLTKYRAIKTVVDGITFASKAEAARYQDLKLLERSGYITGLTLQPRFPIVIEGKKICSYVADFSYQDKSHRHVIEDVKGCITPTYRLKKKLFEAVYPMLRVTEIR